VISCDLGFIVFLVLHSTLTSRTRNRGGLRVPHFYFFTADEGKFAASCVQIGSGIWSMGREKKKKVR
jgi:hypothetical protein